MLLLEYNRSLKFPSSWTLKVYEENLPIDYQNWKNKLWMYNSKK